MLTNLVLPERMGWSRLVQVMAINPRSVLRLDPVRIEAGSGADLTLIDPSAQVDVTPEYLQGKAKNSAFLGAHLTGAATDTFVGGRHVLVNGTIA